MVEASRVAEVVAADRAADSQPAADGVVVDRSAVVDVVVDALQTVDKSVAVELTVVDAAVDEQLTVDNRRLSSSRRDGAGVGERHGMTTLDSVLGPDLSRFSVDDQRSC